jgi:hypothetical protein
MPRARVWVAGWVSVLLLGCVPSPILWSPDGKWLAYTMAVRPTDRILAPGWLFAPDAGREAAGLFAASGRPRGGLSYRLWATRAEDGTSVLLEEGRGPLTSPAWKPDGTALAFGRLVPEPEGRARFEIVVQEAPGRQRVLLASRLGGFKVEAEGLPGLAVCWSPDGRHLAVPQLQPLGLAVLRADTGRVLKTVEDAFFPSWSPDGTKLAFYGSGDPEGLYCLDATFGAPRHLAPSPSPASRRSGRPTASRCWSSARRRRRPAPRRRRRQAELVRVHLETAKGRAGPAPGARADGPRPDLPGGLLLPRPRRRAPVLHDEHRGAGHADHLASAPGPLQPQAVRAAGQSVPLGALAVSPAGRQLALRVGPPDILSPPALCDPETEALTLIVPDDAARAEWIATLVATARSIVRRPDRPAGRRRAPGRAGHPAAGPRRAGRNDPAAARLRQVGRLGRPLCDRPADAPPPARRCGPCWTRPGCSSTTSAPIIGRPGRAGRRSRARTTQPDRTLQLLGVRAQIYLGLGDLERARATISYLNAARPGASAGRDGPRRPGPEPRGRPARGLAHLPGRAVRGPGARRRLGRPRPARLGHRNPDNPEPDLVLDPADVPLPVFAPPPPLPVAPLELVPVAPPLPRRRPGPSPRALPKREAPQPSAEDERSIGPLPREGGSLSRRMQRAASPSPALSRGRGGGSAGPGPS